MARVAILGYGRMGKAIEQILIARGHTVTFTVSKNTNLDTLSWDQVDVAIDFSSPSSARMLCQLAHDKGVSVVSGSTGWPVEEFKANNDFSTSAFLHASNMSLGVNAMFAANELLSKIVGNSGEYSTHLHEVHHIHKLDAPSGTAIALANGAVEYSNALEKWTFLEDKKVNSNNEQLIITSERKGEVFGIHEVTYESEIDTIKLYHEAKSRKGFALGAVIASEYLLGKQGVHTMKNVLGIPQF